MTVKQYDLSTNSISNITPHALENFYGSQDMWRDPLFKFIYTDGIRFIRMNGVSWLVELIASLQPMLAKNLAAENVNNQFWFLRPRENSGAILFLEDGNDNILFQRVIEFTDFPFKNFPENQFAVWLLQGTMLLPSEY